jgi:hypothetical protein
LLLNDTRIILAQIESRHHAGDQAAASAVRGRDLCVARLPAVLERHRQGVQIVKMLALCRKPVSSTLRQKLDDIEPPLKVHASGMAAGLGVRLKCHRLLPHDQM